MLASVSTFLLLKLKKKLNIQIDTTIKALQIRFSRIDSQILACRKIYRDKNANVSA